MCHPIEQHKNKLTSKREMRKRDSKKLNLLPQITHNKIP